MLHAMLELDDQIQQDAWKTYELIVAALRQGTNASTRLVSACYHWSKHHLSHLHRTGPTWPAGAIDQRLRRAG